MRMEAREELMGLLSDAMAARKGIEAHIRTFDDQEAGMAHAARLLDLKRGDTVYWRAKDCAPVKSVFVEFSDGYGTALLVCWNPDKKIVHPGQYPFPSLLFEDEITEEMRALPTAG